MTQPVDMSTILGPTAPAEKPKTGSGVFDQEMFLSLLVAQLRYQNPLKPMDSTEFMSQASQLATVETLQGIAASQAETLTWQRSLAAASLVGREVSGVDSAGDPATGTVERVSISANAVDLVLDSGKTVPLASVTSVAQPAED